MPTLVTIGINTPADGYNYYIGPCGGTLVAYPGNTTTQDVIQVDLEDPIYGFVGGETTYCYQICTVELSNADFDPGGGSSGTSGSSNEVCCCEGQGTLNDPIPTPSDPPDEYGVSVTSCCGVSNQFTFLVDSGSPAPQPGQVYLIFGTCYTINSVDGSTGPPVENPFLIANGCVDEYCQCTWQLLSCRSGANGPLVSFDDNTYIPTTGQNGDIYTLNDVCYYFSPVPSSAQPILTIQQSELTSGGCDSCGGDKENFVFKECATGEQVVIEVTDIPNNVTNADIEGSAVINSGIGSPFPNSLSNCLTVMSSTEGTFTSSITYATLSSAIVGNTPCSCPNVRVPVLSCDGVTELDLILWEYTSIPQFQDIIYIPAGATQGLFPAYEDECYRVLTSAIAVATVNLNYNSITTASGPTDCSDAICP
jgi:hypothetical protein